MLVYRDEDCRDARKKTLLYLKKVNQHFIDHEIFDDIEILEFLKKHEKS